MALDLYRHVRLLPDAALDALAELAAIVRIEGVDPADATEFAAFEREVRARAAPTVPLPAGPAGPRAGRKARPKGEPSSARDESPPKLTKPCQECGTGRVASCPSALRRMGPLCRACNGRRNLPRGRKPEPPQGAGSPPPTGGPGPASDTDPACGPDPACWPAAEEAPASRPSPPALERPKVPPGRLALGPAVPGKVSPEAAPPEKVARRFTCSRPSCKREFIALAEPGKEIPFCETCRHTPPVIREDRVVGDGTGGLEAGRVYHRKVLAPAGWREAEPTG